MPEFPEVNVQVKYLRERVEGIRITSFSHKGWGHFKEMSEQGSARDEVLQDFFVGNALDRVYQRGKRVVMTTGRGTVLSHLMFKGRWSVEGDVFTSNYRHHKTPPKASSVTVRLGLSDGQQLCFHSPEWKARVSIYPGAQPDDLEVLTKLGPEVIATDETAPGFDYPTWELRPFERASGRSRQAIKTFLLDQKKISGIGNMYACEALYSAGIAPDRPANSLSSEELESLYDAVQNVMREAISSGLDYEHLIQVYRREVDPQGRPVQTSQVGGRDTFWVPQAQS